MGIKQIIKEMVGQQVFAKRMKVIKEEPVDSGLYVCLPLDLDDDENNYVYNVKTFINDENVVNYSYKKPTLGSYVLCVPLSATEWFIVESNDTDKLIINSNQGSQVIVEQKISLFNNNEDLYDILNDLIDTINKITVPTSTGPSSTPINFADFESIKTRINNLLKKGDSGGSGAEGTF